MKDRQLERVQVSPYIILLQVLLSGTYTVTGLKHFKLKFKIKLKPE